MLDYVAVGALDPERIEEVVGGDRRGLPAWPLRAAGRRDRRARRRDGPGDLDVAGFAVGVVERGEELGPDRVRAGDVLVGLASPGLRSNGYSLARQVLLERAGLASTSRPGEGADARWATSCSVPR